jgi:hypothetical protein
VFSLVQLQSNREFVHVIATRRLSGTGDKGDAEGRRCDNDNRSNNGGNRDASPPET